MKVLVLGGTGMIGHRMWASLSRLGHDVYSVCRSDLKLEMKNLGNLNWSKSWQGVDVTDIAALESIFSDLKPEMTLNCVGIVKQHPLAKCPATIIELNSLFPHQLTEICRRHGSRLLQMSTDCVFSGEKGYYSEKDVPDAVDLYGRTKILGEVDSQEHVITLRTSSIGREVRPHGGLIEWFLSQKGKKVKGYTKAIYSGFPTETLAKVIHNHILPNPFLKGIYHVASEPINKYQLLQLAKEVLKVDIEVEKDDSFAMDRSLDPSTFRKVTDAPIWEWKDIISDLKVDFDFYNSLER